MKKHYLIVLIIVFILIVALFFIFSGKEETYQFKVNTLYYSEARSGGYEILESYENDSLTIHKIKFDSRPFLQEDTEIYGLLFAPGGEVPGVVLLPGGGGTKEGESKLAMKIAKLGYAVLTIDQRGIGETNGTYLAGGEDYKIFLEGNEPVQHLVVYDVLQASQVLREFKEEKVGEVGIIGESMGARYGLIAAAIDKRLKGVIVISSAGFHIDINPLQEGNNYLVSIDPDHYIKDINFLGMLHGTKDMVVSLEDAEITFEKAKEPKRFFIAESCEHGYCDKMYEELKIDLEEMFRTS